MNLAQRLHPKLIRSFLEVMGFRAWHVVPPVVIGLLSAALDSVAMGLLVPLARGIADNDFASVWNLPGFRHVGGSLHAALIARGVENRGTFLLLVGMVFGAIILRIANGYLSSQVSAYRNGLYAARAKSHTFARCLSFGKLYFDRRSQAQVEHLIGQSKVVLETLDLIEGTFTGTLRVMAHVAILLSVSWRLTVLTALILPLVRWSSKAIVRRIEKTAHDAHRADLGHARYAFNVLASLALVKTHSREVEARTEYDGFLERSRHLSRRQARLTSLVGPIGYVMVFVALFVNATGAVMLTTSDATKELSTFCAFLVIARQTMPLFDVFTHFRVGLARLSPGLADLAQIFDDQGKCFVQSGPRTFEGLTRGIEIRDLRFSYDEGQPVFDGLSVSIPAQRATAIVGSSGCGKTTLVSLLARLYECPAGTILLDGVDIRELSLESLHSRMAVVGQDAWLYNDTLRNNLVYGLDPPPSEERIREVLAAACLENLVRTLPQDLETMIGDRGVKLSGGEKQRLAIARALLRSADLILLDEATSALDTETELAIQHALEAALQGKTVILVAHRLSTLRGVDRILVIRDGRLQEAGTWPELLAARGVFHDLWQAQTVAGATLAPSQRAPGDRTDA